MGSPDPQQNIVLHMKADFADIGSAYFSAKATGQCRRRQFLTDLDTAGHQRHKTILQHFPGISSANMYPTHFHGSVNRSCLVHHRGKETEHDRQWDNDFFAQAHPQHGSGELADCGGGNEIAAHGNPRKKSG